MHCGCKKPPMPAPHECGCGCGGYMKPMPLTHAQGPCHHVPTGPCKVIHKYHVEHVPVYIDHHTHIVNHKVMKPVYYPKYTCSEEEKIEDCMPKCHR